MNHTPNNTRLTGFTIKIIHSGGTQLDTTALSGVQGTEATMVSVVVMFYLLIADPSCSGGWVRESSSFLITRFLIASIASLGNSLAEI